MDKTNKKENSETQKDTPQKEAWTFKAGQPGTLVSESVPAIKMLDVVDVKTSDDFACTEDDLDLDTDEKKAGQNLDEKDEQVKLLIESGDKEIKEAELEKKEETKQTSEQLDKPKPDKPKPDEPKPDEPKPDEPKPDDKIEPIKSIEITPPTVETKPAYELVPLKTKKEQDEKLSKLPFVFGAFFTVVAISLLLAVLMLNLLPPVIESVAVSEFMNDDGTVGIAVTVSDIPFRLNENYMCAITESATVPQKGDPSWVSFNNGVASANVNFSDVNIFVMDEKGTISSSTESVSIDKVYDVSITQQPVYLALEDSTSLQAEVVYLGEVDTEVSWNSSDSSVVAVQHDGKVTAISNGKATITASVGGIVSNELVVTATDLINIPDVDRVRPYLEGEVYTMEQAHLMDEILASRIAEAGFGTRAGALAAARFMMLEFPYRLHYFFENGRLSPNPGRPTADGEGRYYHIGMFLSEDKYDGLDPIRFGPAYWGLPLLNFQEEQIWVAGRQYPNGLTCSGFVAWALLNGGFDVGDMGAGNEYWDNDLCDLGEWAPPTLETIESGIAKPGDLIGWDGHIAMLAGWDDENIYIAETYSQIRGTRMTVIEREKFDYQLYEYIVLMDDVYLEDGEYTNELY